MTKSRLPTICILGFCVYLLVFFQLRKQKSLLDFFGQQENNFEASFWALNNKTGPEKYLLGPRSTRTEPVNYSICRNILCLLKWVVLLEGNYVENIFQYFFICGARSSFKIYANF